MENQIIENIKNEFKNGKYQADPRDLVFEVQFRLGCSYSQALNVANKIRIGK